ncbi:putative Early nodulin-like protein 9 [Hibiscus syriacus]|uniref:Early nodulin-like protein 9 n=1 Tax=Hibiscus syriacus TaxID=106335 RepID=A0A6A2XZ60_HIBSY|nr:putative Early nodulin-like protein 9 [Hibiscus syriacus]
MLRSFKVLKNEDESIARNASSDSYSIVQVDIKNEGIDSFKPDIFGDTIIIEHRIAESTSSNVLKDCQGYPSIRIFRKGSDVRESHGHHEHKSYYGDRDTETLVKMTGGCRIEGYVHAKKVPGNLIISARSGAHSFDASRMNMSHLLVGMECYVFYVKLRGILAFTVPPIGPIGAHVISDGKLLQKILSTLLTPWN